MAGNGGIKPPLQQFIRRIRPFYHYFFLGPLIKRAKRFIDVYGGGAEGGNVLPLLWGGGLVPIWHILAYNILLRLPKIFLGAMGPFLGVYNGAYRLGLEYFTLGTSNSKTWARELLPNIGPYKYQRLILLTNRERGNRSRVNGLPGGYTPPFTG